jgi:hypothetical protein
MAIWREQCVLYEINRDELFGSKGGGVATEPAPFTHAVDFDPLICPCPDHGGAEASAMSGMLASSQDFLPVGISGSTVPAFGGGSFGVPPAPFVPPPPTTPSMAQDSYQSATGNITAASAITLSAQPESRTSQARMAEASSALSASVGTNATVTTSVAAVSVVNALGSASSSAVAQAGPESRTQHVSYQQGSWQQSSSAHTNISAERRMASDIARTQPVTSDAFNQLQSQTAGPSNQREVVSQQPRIEQRLNSDQSNPSVQRSTDQSREVIAQRVPERIENTRSTEISRPAEVLTQSAAVSTRGFMGWASERNTPAPHAPETTAVGSEMTRSQRINATSPLRRDQGASDRRALRDTVHIGLDSRQPRAEPARHPSHSQLTGSARISLSASPVQYRVQDRVQNLSVTDSPRRATNEPRSVRVVEPAVRARESVRQSEGRSEGRAGASASINLSRRVEPKASSQDPAIQPASLRARATAERGSVMKGEQGVRPQISPKEAVATRGVARGAETKAGQAITARHDPRAENASVRPQVKIAPGAAAVAAERATSASRIGGPKIDRKVALKDNLARDVSRSGERTGLERGSRTARATRTDILNRVERMIARIERLSRRGNSSDSALRQLDLATRIMDLMDEEYEGITELRSGRRLRGSLRARRQLNKGLRKGTKADEEKRALRKKKQQAGQESQPTAELAGAGSATAASATKAGSRVTSAKTSGPSKSLDIFQAKTDDDGAGDDETDAATGSSLRD